MNKLLKITFVFVLSFWVSGCMKPKTDPVTGEKVLIENYMKKIHALVNERMVDLAGRFVFNSQGQEIFN